MNIITILDESFNKDSNTWNIHEDTNKDGIIDIYDISYISFKLN